MATENYLYIKCGDQIFFFDAVTDVDLRYSNTVTSNPIQDGRDASDHIFSNPTTITYTGLISDFKILGKENSIDAKSNTAWLDGVIQNNILKEWSLKYRVDKELESGYRITEVSPALKKMGGLDDKNRPITCYEISITFQKVLYAQSPTIVTLQAKNGKENGNTAPKKKKESNTKQVNYLNDPFAVGPIDEGNAPTSAVGESPYVKYGKPKTKLDRISDFIKNTADNLPPEATNANPDIN